MIKSIALVLMVAAGCGGSQKGGDAPAEQPCARAAANARAQARAIVAGAADVDDPARLEADAVILERVVAERCAADAWSAAAIDCMAAATLETMDACRHQLTEEQRDAAGEQLDRELAEAHGLTDDAPPPPPTPADPCGGGE